MKKLFITRRNVEKLADDFTLKSLSIDKILHKHSNKEIKVDIDEDFKAVSCTSIITIIGMSVEITKLGAVKMFINLMFNRKGKDWMKGFEYFNGQWTYCEQNKGMSSLELAIIKKKIDNLPTSTTGLIIDSLTEL